MWIMKPPCLLPRSSAPSSLGPGRAKGGDDEAIGRSRGGLRTKIPAPVDALGNPTGCTLTGGAASELVGADRLLPAIAATTVIAANGYDAEARVLAPLRAAGKAAVIPPRRNRPVQRDDDRELYQARHRIENCFCRLNQCRAIATRYDQTTRTFLAALSCAAATILLH